MNAVPTTMAALVKDHAGPGLELRKVPVPRPAVGEVLVKILRTGICGTDLQIHRWSSWAQRTIDPPMIPGHEFVGEIVAAAAETGGFVPGQLVGAEGHIVCGRCRHCRAGDGHLCPETRGLGVGRDGVFAEYATLPATAVWRHPPDIDLDTATMFDPFGNAVHAATQFPVLDQTVAVTGAGPIGLMAIPVLQHLHARAVVVADPSEFRRDLAIKQGASAVCLAGPEPLASAAKELGCPEGFDIGLEMSGHPDALGALLATVATGGRVAVLGLPAQAVRTDWADISTRMLTVQGVSGRRIFHTWHQMAALVDAGITPASVVTHHFAHTDHATAFDLAASTSAGKLILTWSERGR
ncbi:L-threonine 3-dehydrogenase [Actinocrispum wychmicini]|uniref:Threonine 3-dehydrogenase n=1 Tax=Actinocrispum wychmicini TaxID=1213861 RepID=A0A4R2JI75_9PSEU|nr:L-threonine 3-dehydrogenase [Actinocrispum wychmicini]TCO59601.1 threonine 3-dehydrogenase [Actinocrispum wychmicini]